MDYAWGIFGLLNQNETKSKHNPFVIKICMSGMSEANEANARYVFSDETITDNEARFLTPTQPTATEITSTFTSPRPIQHLMTYGLRRISLNEPLEDGSFGLRSSTSDPSSPPFNSNLSVSN